jgi:hypothetical protein
MPAVSITSGGALKTHETPKTSPLRSVELWCRMDTFGKAALEIDRFSASRLY